VFDRTRFVRETRRRTWSRGARDYAVVAAGHGAHTAMPVAKAGPRPGERVLDVGTGSGVVAGAAAAAVGPTGRVVATDLVPEWGDVVAAACAAAGVGDVAFRAMGAEALDLPDAASDLALSQSARMFVPEPGAALREMRRVLRAGGRLGAAVWSTPDKVEHQALGRRVLVAPIPPPPPAERQPTPTELGEPGLIERLVAEAGFREIAVDRRTLETTYESLEAYWRHLTFSDYTRAALGRLPVERVERIRDELAAALAEHQRDGQLSVASAAVYVTATR
jgi:ubiquinone/menaquinone biosynthesis C-methylase UbiE